MSEKIEVNVYCDSTDLFSESECDRDSMCYMLFDEEIVQLWFVQNEFEKYGSYKTWLSDEYTCDDTDGLYYFAVEHGCRPVFKDEDDGYFGVYYVDDDSKEKRFVYEGTYTNCREVARDRYNWTYDGNELMVGVVDNKYLVISLSDGCSDARIMTATEIFKMMDMDDCYDIHIDIYRIPLFGDFPKRCTFKGTWHNPDKPLLMEICIRDVVLDRGWGMDH